MTFNIVAVITVYLVVLLIIVFIRGKINGNHEFKFVDAIIAIIPIIVATFDAEKISKFTISPSLINFETLENRVKAFKLSNVDGLVVKTRHAFFVDIKDRLDFKPSAKIEIELEADLKREGITYDENGDIQPVEKIDVEAEIVSKYDVLREKNNEIVQKLAEELDLKDGILLKIEDKFSYNELLALFEVIQARSNGEDIYDLELIFADIEGRFIAACSPIHFEGNFEEEDADINEPIVRLFAKIDNKFALSEYLKQLTTFDGEPCQTVDDTVTRNTSVADSIIVFDRLDVDLIPVVNDSGNIVGNLDRDDVMNLAVVRILGAFSSSDKVKK